MGEPSASNSSQVFAMPVYWNAHHPRAGREEHRGSQGVLVTCPHLAVMVAADLLAGVNRFQVSVWIWGVLSRAVALLKKPVWTPCGIWAVLLVASGLVRKRQDINISA